MGNDLRTLEVSIAGTIACGADHHSGFIRNLTTASAMFEGVCELVRGENVFLAIEGLGWIYATVAWALPPRYGLSFNAPIANGKLAFLRDQELLHILKFEQIAGTIIRPSAEDFLSQASNG